MQYKTLGNTGMLVSTLCLGTMTFSGGEGFWKNIGSTNQKEADELIKASIDAGVNFFDTADVYSEGQSETMLGQSLKNLNIARKDVVVATKVYGRVGPGRNDVGASRGHIMDGIEASLRRLQTDHIDLYQIHGNDVVTPIEETLRALDTLVQQGKVRYIGCSNWQAWKIARALSISEPKRPGCWFGVPSPAVCFPESSAARIKSRKARAVRNSISRSSIKNAPGKFSTRSLPSPKPTTAARLASHSRGCWPSQW